MQTYGDGSLRRGRLPRGWVLTAAALMAALIALTGCRGVVRDAATLPTTPATEVPTTGPDIDRLTGLRAGDDFDEFAEHQRAAKADGARLAWENFAPIVDDKRVEWSNKAELWDSIVPKIRDEALLLGPEYRKPMWNARNAIPNGISMAWNNEKTAGRGHFVEFGVTYEHDGIGRERYWGFLIQRDAKGAGVVMAAMPAIEVSETDFASLHDSQEALSDEEWSWVEAQPLGVAR